MPAPRQRSIKNMTSCARIVSIVISMAGLALTAAHGTAQKTPAVKGIMLEEIRSDDVAG
jgi:hypothetical protein